MGLTAKVGGNGPSGNWLSGNGLSGNEPNREGGWERPKWELAKRERPKWEWAEAGMDLSGNAPKRNRFVSPPSRTRTVRSTA